MFRHHLPLRLGRQSIFLRQKSGNISAATSHGGAGSSSIDHPKVGGIEGTLPSDGKLPTRQPLVKNFFMGVVDKELLAFPEVIQREELTKLKNEMLPSQNFFSEINTATIDATSMPPTILQNVSELGLFGNNVPIAYDGKGYSLTESLLASEPETNCVDVAVALLSHRVLVDVLKEVGTEEQQKRLLSKLASGKLVGSEAIFEFTAPEYDYFNTTAEYSADTQTWMLSGEKAFVVSGTLLDTNATNLYLVIAQTQRSNMTGDAARGSTIFLVDGNTTGVKLGEQHLTTGCRGVQMRRVKFDQVCVPESSVLGQPHYGNEIAEVLLRCSRLRHAHISLGMAKNIVKDMAQYIIESKQCGVDLKDMEIAQTRLAKATCNTYAMESMIYYTASIFDEFSRQDVALEAAISKFFSITHLLRMSTECVDMIGPKSLHTGQATELAFRNATQLYTQGESIDTLRLFIALSGLQHAGTQMNDSVQKSRNPLFNPGHMFGKFFQRDTIDHPRTKMELGENLHPTLVAAAQSIEHSVARLRMCVELLLTRHGNSIIECHNEMLRLTEMTTAIYAMFASTSRASRSYCIGLHLSDYEMLAAMTICAEGSERVKSLCLEVFNGRYANNDNNLKRISKQLVKSKSYFAKHPLNFNF